MRWICALLIITLVGCQTVVEPAKADPIDLVRGNNTFAVDLYRQLSHTEGNLFLSPYSIYTALAMTSAGARGQTEQQMMNQLHFPPRQELLQSMAQIIRSMKERGAKKEYQLNSANALWGAKDSPFKADFLRVAKEYYGADLTNLDFARDPEGCRQAINRWAEKETNDKIRDLITSGILSSETRLVLTNAIYFKADWVSRFDKSLTSVEDFRVLSNQTTKVHMMNGTRHYAYLETDTFQALQMPYAGNDLALVALLPKKDDLAGLDEKLSTELIDSTIAKLAEQDVEVKFPKFKSTSQFELVPALKSLGLTLPFGPDADFSGMSAKPLLLTKVIHKAFVDINEEGTEAAAATAVIATRGGPPETPHPPVFRADHPFIYMIRDLRTGTILFMGRLSDPSK
jgi:serpin B